jgi:hypothetical protein
MLTSRYVANVLRKLEKSTPQTNRFEEERDETGERKYAQKEAGAQNRWWDKSTGTQKEHVVCWFARRYYSEGSTKDCIENNLIENCKECYFEKIRRMPNCKQMIEAKRVFRYMQRPEMYLWIAEALDIIDEKELENCITELKGIMDENPKKWNSVIKKYITWEMIESSLQIEVGE